MKFFIPATDYDEHAELVYQSVKKSLTDQYGHKVSNARIRQITVIRNGKATTDTVGERSSLNGEIVVAIFDADTVYLVCTAFRGVARGEPMLAGKWQTQHVEYFDFPTI